MDTRRRRQVKVKVQACCEAAVRLLAEAKAIGRETRGERPRAGQWTEIRTVDWCR